MKKFIYTISFLAMTLILGGTPAFAQTDVRLDAKIPFDFSIGNETFDAGNYVMRVKRTPTGIDMIEVRDAKYNLVYQAFVARNGGESEGNPELVFDRASGQAVLSKILLNDKGYNVPMEKNGGTVLAAKERKRQGGSSN